jgi:hypothetical protein
VAKISIGSNILTWYGYISWSTVQTGSTATLSASMSNLSINAVFDDGNPAGNVILVISQSGSTNNDSVTGYFVTIPKTAFTAGPFPMTPLDSAPHRDNLSKESFGFANGSVFAYDTKSSSYIRINPADASIQSSFYSGSKNQQPRVAYRVSGGSFYSFDTNTRILTKYTAWW